MNKITNKTRKVIWSKSGGKCAICRQELTKLIEKNHLVLGQECHIRSPKINGPRYDSKYARDKLDMPENLILLCRNHHKEIDDFPHKYTVEALEKVKANHEHLIANRSSHEIPPVKVIKKSNYLETTLITSGMQLIDMASDAMGYGYSVDETDDEDTYELIKEFLGYIEDLDILPEIDVSSRLDLGKELKNIIKKLEDHGYFVYGAIANDIITGGISGDAPWKTVYYILTTNKELHRITR